MSLLPNSEESCLCTRWQFCGFTEELTLVENSNHWTIANISVSVGTGGKTFIGESWYRTAQLTQEGVRQQKERVWWSRKASWTSKCCIGIVKSFTWRVFSGSWHLALYFFFFFYSCVYCTITNKKINQWTSLVAFNWLNGALKILTSAYAVDSMSEMCFWVFCFLPHCRIHKSPSDRHPTTHHDPLCAAFTVLWGFGHYTQALKIVFCFFLKYFFFFSYFCPALRRR